MDDARRQPVGEGPLRLLHSIFERGAESASHALSQWLGRPVHLEVAEVRQADLSEAGGLLGPEDAMVAACGMQLSGRLSGHLLLVFGDRAGLALADLLLRRPTGTASSWGDLERSAALETANIVGCAFLNALAAHLPSAGASGAEALTPSPPVFRHEFAGTLLQFALMDQTMLSDRVLLVRSTFRAEGEALDWSLLFAPGAESLRDLFDAARAAPP